MNSARILGPQGLAKSDGLSDGRLDAEARYQASVATWGEDRAQVEEQRRTIVADAETVTAGELRQRRETIDAAELDLAQRTVVLSREYVSHQESRLGELKAYRDKADKAFADAEKLVIQKLAKAGITVESMPPYHANPAAAEVQFKHRVAESSDYQSARTLAIQAASQVTATVDAIRSGKERIAEAVAVLKTVAERIAGVSVSSAPRLAGLAA